MWFVAVAAWFVEALVLGYVMGRRGYEAYSWTAIGLFLGPIAVAIAIAYLLRPPSRAPHLVTGGQRGTGDIDVLIGVDGSPESQAAVRHVEELFAATTGRITLARVVPIDATTETERLAEAQLAAERAAHPEIDPTTVVLRGAPASALRDYAATLGYDVLVVGTRGIGRTKAVLGSVATGLAREVGVPVLLVGADPILSGRGTAHADREPRAVGDRDAAGVGTDAGGLHSVL